MSSPNQLSDQIGRRLKWDELDWLVVAAPGDNQLQAVPRLLDRYPPKQVLWANLDSTTNSAITLRGDLQTAGIPIIKAEKGQILDLGSGARLRVLSVSSHGAILFLEWQDFRALLPLGAGLEELASLMSSHETGQVSALLLAGNGQARQNPPGWIENLRPQAILLSVARQDEQGLPSQDLLDELEGRTLLRTDLNGWIELTTDGKQMWVEVERK